jgi:4'-phosphopantetheinyl transferase
VSHLARHGPSLGSVRGTDANEPAADAIHAAAGGGVPAALGDGCQVWWAPAAAAHPALAGLLDRDERERMARFVRAQDRALYLVAHALARLVLAPLVGVPASRIRFVARCATCGGPHGKPAVAGSAAGSPAGSAAGGTAPELSISHSGARVAVALSRSPVGVDVEQVTRRPMDDGLVRTVLTPAEQASLDRLPAADRHRGLLTYWTRKEALVKATGEGLAVPLTDLTVSGPGEPPRLVSWAGRVGMAAAVHLADLDPGPDHLGCLAVLAAERPAVAELDATPLLTRHTQARP